MADQFYVKEDRKALNDDNLDGSLNCLELNLEYSPNLEELEELVTLVVDQISCSRSKAMKALIKCNCDVSSAILQVTNSSDYGTCEDVDGLFVCDLNEKINNDLTYMLLYNQPHLNIEDFVSLDGSLFDKYDKSSVICDDLDDTLDCQDSTNNCEDIPNIDELIKLVRYQTMCSESAARKALLKCEGDVVCAILNVTT